MNDVNLIDGVEVPLTDAEQAEKDAKEAAALAAQPNALIKQQIVDLEATITERRRDEAILGQDTTGWLANVRLQITALRERLT